MPPLGARNDRNVRNCRLLVGPAAPIHKLTFTLEEALRLCSLPGENEGRVYYFRRVQVAGLPENGDRNLWFDAFQNALLACARNAVDGRLIDAARAEAVYFRSQQEACESLLDRIIRRQPLDPWFWPAVSESAPGASAATHVVGVIAKLSRSDASWLSVAAAVFVSSNPMVLLSLVSESMARAWLRELHREGTSSRPIAIRNDLLHVIARAVRTFGADDPRVIWLASLAVVLASPSEIDSGTPVTYARAILRTFLQSSAHRGERAPTETAVGPRDHQIPGWVRASAVPRGFRPANSVEEEKPKLETTVPVIRTHAAHPDRCFGERTEGAGLYFLLNAMKHIRLSEHQPSPQSLAQLFQRIARYAGIKPEDPILLWTWLIPGQTGSEAINGRMLCAWLRKIRRWCWRNGKIGLRAIVRRPGLVTLTRTDLDISLSIDSADVRIRRIGLDLDPGWLPWFGRVVHFHYLYRGDLYG
jgi:hypothetical protein